MSLVKSNRSIARETNSHREELPRRSRNVGVDPGYLFLSEFRKMFGDEDKRVVPIVDYLSGWAAVYLKEGDDLYDKMCGLVRHRCEGTPISFVQTLFARRTPEDFMEYLLGEVWVNELWGLFSGGDGKLARKERKKIEYYLKNPEGEYTNFDRVRDVTRGLSKKELRSL